MKDAASKIINIVRSLLQVLHDHEKAEGAAETLAYALIQLSGWQPVARALARYADDHAQASEVHAYLRKPASNNRQNIDDPDVE